MLQLSVNRSLLAESQLTEVTNVGSLLPGHQVSALVTSVDAAGLNVQVCGFFEGTIDLAHLDLKEEDIEDQYKVGTKVRDFLQPVAKADLLTCDRSQPESSTTTSPPHHGASPSLLYHTCFLCPVRSCPADQSLSSKLSRSAKPFNQSRSRVYCQTGVSCAAQMMV